MYASLNRLEILFRDSEVNAAVCVQMLEWNISGCAEPFVADLPDISHQIKVRKVVNFPFAHNLNVRDLSISGDIF